MNVDLEGVLTVLRQSALDVMDEAPSMPVPAATAPVDLIIFGAAMMRDRILESLDVWDYEVLDETDLQDHKERVERFCLGYCYFGRQAGEPGLHPRCTACPLRPLVVDVIANQVSHAMVRDE